MIGVEKEHEQTRAGVLGHRARLGHGVRFDAGFLRAGGADHDVFELLDLLRDAVFDNLELLLAQIGNRRAIPRRVDVDAHVVGFGPEGRLRRRKW